MAEPDDDEPDEFELGDELAAGELDATDALVVECVLVWCARAGS
ncbi:MAG TPA: hypothetical protein VHW04_17140 [Solirubrobacteraceae bacterium]|nr:hypothetical protein [Solirubrobacteraceae bacterium]